MSIFWTRRTLMVATLSSGVVASLRVNASPVPGQLDTDPDLGTASEINQWDSDARASSKFTEEPNHALVHLRLREFLSSVIGQPKEQRVALAESYLEKVDPLDFSYVLAESAAYGVIVRGTAIRDVLRAGYHRSSREGLNFALSEYPDSPWTSMLNASWHFEVIRRSTIGATLMGASENKGEAFLNDAFEISFGDPGLYLAASISLLSDPNRKSFERAKGLIEEANLQFEELSQFGLVSYLPDEYLMRIDEHTTQLGQIIKDENLERAQEYVLEIF